MEKLVLTGKETEEELAEALTVHLTRLTMDMVTDVVVTAMSVPSGLKELAKTQLGVQKVGEGAMKSHFVYYAASILPEKDLKDLLENFLRAVSGEQIEKLEGPPLIYLPNGGRA